MQSIIEELRRRRTAKDTVIADLQSTLRDREATITVLQSRISERNAQLGDFHAAEDKRSASMIATPAPDTRDAEIAEIAELRSTLAALHQRNAELVTAEALSQHATHVVDDSKASLLATISNLRVEREADRNNLEAKNRTIEARNSTIEHLRTQQQLDQHAALDRFDGIRATLAEREQSLKSLTVNRDYCYQRINEIAKVVGMHVENASPDAVLCNAVAMRAELDAAQKPRVWNIGDAAQAVLSRRNEELNRLLATAQKARHENFQCALLTDGKLQASVIEVARLNGECSELQAKLAAKEQEVQDLFNDVKRLNMALLSRSHDEVDQLNAQFAEEESLPAGLAALATRYTGFGSYSDAEREAIDEDTRQELRRRACSCAVLPLPFTLWFSTLEQDYTHHSVARGGPRGIDQGSLSIKHQGGISQAHAEANKKINELREGKARMTETLEKQTEELKSMAAELHQLRLTNKENRDFGAMLDKARHAIRNANLGIVPVLIIPAINELIALAHEGKQSRLNKAHSDTQMGQCKRLTNEVLLIASDRDRLEKNLESTREALNDTKARFDELSELCKKRGTELGAIHKFAVETLGKYGPRFNFASTLDAVKLVVDRTRQTASVAEMQSQIDDLKNRNGTQYQTLVEVRKAALSSGLVPTRSSVVDMVSELSSILGNRDLLCRESLQALRTCKHLDASGLGFGRLPSDAKTYDSALVAGAVSKLEKVSR